MSLLNNKNNSLEEENTNVSELDSDKAAIKQRKREEKLAELLLAFPYLGEMVDDNGDPVTYTFEMFERMLPLSKIVKAWSDNYDMVLKEAAAVPDNFKRYGLKKDTWELLVKERKVLSEAMKASTERIRVAKADYNKVLKAEARVSEELFENSSVVLRVLTAGTRLLSEEQKFQISAVHDVKDAFNLKKKLIDQAIQDWVDAGNFNEVPDILKMK